MTDVIAESQPHRTDENHPNVVERATIVVRLKKHQRRALFLFILSAASIIFVVGIAALRPDALRDSRIIPLIGVLLFGSVIIQMVRVLQITYFLRRLHAAR